MRRRRKRKAIKWKPVLFVLLLVNIAAGLLFSPITGASSVRVVGADARDHKFIDQTMQELRDVPYLRSKPRDVEGKLQTVGRINRAEISQNIFGRAVVELTYEQPVGVLQGKSQVKLSKGGDLYVDDRVFDDLPRISLPETALQPNLTMASTVELTIMARLCERAKETDLSANIVINVDSKGRLWLNVDGGGLVVLGSSEKLDDKFKRLEAYVEENPEGLKQIKELNLTAPEHPTITR